MILIKNLSEISKSDTMIAGGKGASLGEMMKARISVPPGFVILSSAFDQFLEETEIMADVDAILHRVNYNDVNSVETASEEIQSVILSKNLSKNIEDEIKCNFVKLDAMFVAIRSSATSEDSSTAAWAGQLNTYLNTTESKLIEMVKRCWASLFTPRAIFYRKEKNLHRHKISVAVVVQKMIESEVSGVAFSAHPITQDKNQIVVEAGYGLGESIVSGQITPDSYVIEKKQMAIIDKYVSGQTKAISRATNGGDKWIMIPKEKQTEQKLTDEQILELSKIINKIESHYGFPCDIEWALEKGKFYIVQSRPITTLIESKSNNKSPIILSKLFTRQRSLFFAYMQAESDQKYESKIYNEPIKNMLILGEGKSQKITFWFNEPELEENEEKFLESLKKKKDLFKRIIAEMHKYWKALLPYLNKKKEIQSLSELKQYYIDMIRWGYPMDLIYIIGDSGCVNKKIKEEALKVRADTQEFGDELDYAVDRFLSKSYPQFKEITPVMTPEEIYNIEGLTKKEISTIKKRLQGYAILNGKVILLDKLGIGLKKQGLSLESLEVGSDTKIITGQTACKGYAKGIVKIVLYKNEVHKVEKGDILVSDTTSPEYVPAMKNAAAIVTDEGGMTSHAAIISRELNKPCIVGTKIASKYLKDGNLIEVDADNRIIRILKN